jgi:hypothetical protein
MSVIERLDARRKKSSIRASSNTLIQQKCLTRRNMTGLTGALPCTASIDPGCRGGRSDLPNRRTKSLRIGLLSLLCSAIAK